jgi:hypothetical protein
MSAIALTFCVACADQDNVQARRMVTIDRAELLWAGEYEASDPAAPDVKPTKLTDTIQGKRGGRFGFSFRIVSKPQNGLIELTYTTYVPAPGVPASNPDKRGRELVDKFNCVLGGPCLVGYAFSSNDEIVPGKWVLEVSYEGKKVIEHEFVVEAESGA